MGALDLIRKGAKGIKNSPFFSKADVVLDELQRNKGTGDEFLTEIVKKGAKPTELKERGIEKALKGKPKMTKAEVQKVFQQKAPPKVQEKVLTDVPDYDEWLEAKAQEEYGVDYFDLGRQERAKLDKMYGDLPATQYEKYKTPGGENYREILLKLPAFDSKRLMELEADIRRSESVYRDPMSMPDFRAKLEELETLKAEQAAAGTPYISGHYKQDPNLLAHIRVQDFKTPEGKKVLLVDEVQSDWHQEGRKKGYGKQELEPLSPEEDQELMRLYNMGRDNRTAEESSRMRQLNDRLNSMQGKPVGVPDAPFKKNWHELAMKRVLDYATENGYHTVAITPGAEQAKRYDLSKHVDSVIWERDADGKITFTPEKDGTALTGPKTVGQGELADHLGKEVAEKILRDEETSGALSGIDLQVGGEGMKGFYDKILPDYLNNYGKQYGAQVGELQLQTGQEMSRGPTGSDMIPSYSPTMQSFHSFDITPQMRKQIQTKGQPLYSKIGVPSAEATAGAGAATMGSQMFDENNEQSVQNPVHFTENPDAMLLELMQRN